MNADSMPPRLPATAILLAGGCSTRMGRDKRHLEVNGTSLIKDTYGCLTALFDQVLISIGSPEILVPGARHVRDVRENAGPLGGVVSAMAEADHPLVFVMACDIPDPPGDFIRHMVKQAEEYDVVVPVDEGGHYETLFAVYRRRLLPRLISLLDSGEKQIRRIYNDVATLELEIPPNVTLRNLNTPEDLRAFQSGRTGS